jgi:putative DNA primase/helicase
VSDDVASDTVGANAWAVAKKIVTGDALHVENKGMKPFKFEAFATLISACNDQPNLADTSEGMRRRVWVIPMTAKFTEGGGADVNMREAVTTEAAARYMLHLAVKGLARLQSYGRPTPNPRADAVTHELMVLSDPVAAYIADTGITPAELVERNPKDVYEDFAVWFANEGMPATAKPEQRRFTRRVCATFPGLYTEQNGRDARGRKRRAYRMK